MKAKVYSIAAGCGIVALLWAFSDHLPEFSHNLLVPGFFLGLLINGSLHDRVMPFLVFGLLFNGILYSGLVYFGVRFLGKRWRSR